MSVDTLRLQVPALVLKHVPSTESASLQAIWNRLGYQVHLDRSDPQCAPSRYVYVGGGVFEPWRRDPEELKLFITDVFRRLGQRATVTEIIRHGDEILRHGDDEVVCVLRLVNSRRAYRGMSKRNNSDMNHARYTAMLRALLLAYAGHSLL